MYVRHLQGLLSCYYAKVIQIKILGDRGARMYKVRAPTNALYNKLDKVFKFTLIFWRPNYFFFNFSTPCI